jgi:hypothetical protein
MSNFLQNNVQFSALEDMVNDITNKPSVEAKETGELGSSPPQHSEMMN